jgi:hypothetical protein
MRTVGAVEEGSGVRQAVSMPRSRVAIKTKERIFFMINSFQGSFFFIIYQKKRLIGCICNQLAHFKAVFVKFDQALVLHS